MTAGDGYTANYGIYAGYNVFENDDRAVTICVFSRRVNHVIFPVEVKPTASTLCVLRLE